MQAVLLAAGASSRFWPLVEGRHKSLFVLMGKPLLRWTLESLKRAGVEQAVIVQDPTRAAEAALAGAVDLPALRFVVQPAPRGMADALLCAAAQLAETFFLVHPYHFDAEFFLSALEEKARTSGAGIVLGAQRTDKPWDYGILKLEGDRAVDLVEKPAPGQEPSDLRVLGLYRLSRAFLEDLRAVRAHEYAFEDALGRAMARGAARVVTFAQETPSLKYPWDVLHAAALMLRRFVREPRIDPEAQIDATALIKGPVWIGPRVKVFERAVIKGPGYLGPGCVIGTGALVRDHVVLEAEVLIGAGAEVTRSVFGRGATTHSGFFGDSVFGAGVKLGAGTITANVRVDRGEIHAQLEDGRVPTGRRSLGALVGEGTALGIHSMLMPGVLIGSRCLIGPGKVLKGRIPSGTRDLNLTG